MIKVLFNLLSKTVFELLADFVIDFGDFIAYEMLPWESQMII
jgi:hypothetical protein